MNIHEAFDEVRAEPGLIAEFNRLTGNTLRAKGVGPRGVAAMIDDSTGRTQKGEEEFAAFFMECIWLPLVARESGNGSK